MSRTTFELGRSIGRLLNSSDRTEARPLGIPLDLSDIQGNILGGFNKDHQCLIGLSFRDNLSLRRALGSLSDLVASAEETVRFKDLYKAMRARRGRVDKALSATWINVGLSASGLQVATSEENVRMLGQAFERGGTASALFRSSPDAMALEGAHIVLILASDLPDELTRWRRKTLERLEGARILWEFAGEAMPPPRSAQEHFGFRDGVSQPAVRGLDNDPSAIEPGEFVLGYPTESPKAAHPDWARNGSFLALGRFLQDVAAFERFVARVADELESVGLSGDLARAKLVGRWPSGAPVSLAAQVDSTSLAEDEDRRNAFGFGPEDSDGVTCPFSAHIRKCYPRADDVRSRRRRILRRGVPFGPPYPEPGERGLLFLGYAADLREQFEAVIDEWMSDEAFPIADAGHDPFFGRHADGMRRVHIPYRVPDGESRRLLIETSEEWVRLTHAGYFFAPSISWMKGLANGRAG